MSGFEHQGIPNAKKPRRPRDRYSLSPAGRKVLIGIGWAGTLWLAYQHGYHDGIQASLNCMASLGAVCP